MSTALILAGHGSHISPNTAGLVWRHVDRLRALGVADEITATFWKEKPSFARVMSTLTADDVTVIPLFTANGFFTQNVIPTEMGLNGALTQHNSRIIRYIPTLHKHPYLTDIVRIRVETAMNTFDLQPDQTAIAVIGHSTRRNPDSRQATEDQAQRLRDLQIAAQVQAVYLDDSPEIAEIYVLTDAPNLIAVPYFLAAGSHTSIDVPHELGLESGMDHGSVSGRHVIYTAPVGVDDDLLNVILVLAQEAGAPLSAAAQHTTWNSFPSVGRDVLIEAVRSAGVMRFGGLRLSMAEVRVWGDEDAPRVMETSSVLRTYVRDNPFRSLATSDNLPHGWRVDLTQPEQLHAVVETIYPGIVADWAAMQTGTLHINALKATAQRQVGMYRTLEAMTQEAQLQIIRQLCTGCVQVPSWFNASAHGELPCSEPCNHWLSAALESTK